MHSIRPGSPCDYKAITTSAVSTSPWLRGCHGFWLSHRTSACRALEADGAEHRQGSFSPVSTPPFPRITERHEEMWSSLPFGRLCQIPLLAHRTQRGEKKTRKEAVKRGAAEWCRASMGQVSIAVTSEWHSASGRRWAGRQPEKAWGKRHRQF